jgi:predicted 3-demethylubiquinone-9 3-methyltransferase (glyoxalase superfamily)
MTIRQTITPCLWFDGKAEEAAEFYVSVFPNSRITDVTRNVKDGPGMAALMEMRKIDVAALRAAHGGR